MATPIPGFINFADDAMGFSLPLQLLRTHSVLFLRVLLPTGVAFQQPQVTAEGAKKTGKIACMTSLVHIRIQASELGGSYL